jgi:hypothetical protein
VRWHEIALRVALIIGSAVAINEHASAWVTAPLSLIAIATTIELAVRPYARSTVDRVLIGCGSGVVALILLGLILNLTPSGLTRTTWSVTWAVVGLGVLIWRRNAGVSVDIARIRVPPSAFWAVPVVAVLVAAGFVAQAGVNNEKHPVLALSLLSQTTRDVQVQINATSISGSYRLRAQSDTPGAQAYTSPEFDISAGSAGARIVRKVPTNFPSRWTITLAAVHGNPFTRELIVDVGSSSNAWSDIWAADFAGPTYSSVSTGDWQYVLGNGFGDGEVEKMTNSKQNAHVDGNGDLLITPILQNGQWTSARLQSTRTFLLAPGNEYEISASIMQPDPASGIGYWPAFWMSAPGTQLHDGEVDILEDINGYSEHSATFHCGYERSDLKDPCEVHGVGSGLVACPKCQTTYNTYTVIVDRRNPGAEQIAWYLDGREFFSVQESSVGDTLWDDSFSQPFSIVLEVSMGGVYPNSRCNCTSPLSATSSGASMRVQYVTVAKLAS